MIQNGQQDKKKPNYLFILSLSLSLKLNDSRHAVDRISSAVLRGVSHEGRLIGRGACNQEQEGNKDT